MCVSAGVRLGVCACVSPPDWTFPKNIYSPSAEIYLAGRTSANPQTSDQVTDFQLRIWPLYPCGLRC